jgi:hypothetical protein
MVINSECIFKATDQPLRFSHRLLVQRWRHFKVDTHNGTWVNIKFHYRYSLYRLREIQQPILFWEVSKGQPAHALAMEAANISAGTNPVRQQMIGQLRKPTLSKQNLQRQAETCK